ncbi:MAG: hypothetical protein M9962_00780 [Oligoflexia bacterium]|nr:hypothetical protein [Oligoflexia bacterium]
MAKKINSKYQTQLKISEAILGLEIKKGHLNWKITEVTKKTGLSRPIIYRYFGSNKNKMLSSAIEIFCYDFYGLVEHENLSFSSRLIKAKKKLQENIDPALFYLKWRATTSPLNEAFKKVEAKFQKKLKEQNPNLTQIELLALHTIIHGIVTAPFIEQEEAIQLIQHFTKK